MMRLLPRPDLKKMNFYFMKTDNIRVYEILRCMEILRCLSRSRLYTNMLRKDVFNIFTIKTQRALLRLRPLACEDTDTCTFRITYGSHDKKNI